MKSAQQLSARNATIVYVVPDVSPQAQEFLSIQLMNRVAREGLRTVLVTGVEKSVLDKTTLLCDEAYIVPELSSEQFHWSLWWQKVLAFVQLCRVFIGIARSGPLVVHTHGSEVGFVGRWAAWVAGAEATVHTVYSFAFSGIQKAWQWWLSYVFEYLASWVTSEYICVHLKDRERGIQLLPYFRQRCSVIRAGSLWQEFYIPAQKEKQVTQDDVPVLGLVCDRTQSPEVIIPFLNRMVSLHEKGHRFLVEILGDGEWRTDVEEWRLIHGAQSLVTCLGLQAKAAAIMRTWDLFVVPEVCDVLPVSVVHARLSWLPVVAYATSAMSELVKHRKNGLLAAPGDGAQRDDAIITLLADAPLRQQLAQHNDNLNEFNSVFVSARHIRLYQNVLTF